jgi:hypothetical protein
MRVKVDCHVLSPLAGSSGSACALIDGVFFSLLLPLYHVLMQKADQKFYFLGQHEQKIKLSAQTQVDKKRTAKAVSRAVRQAAVAKNTQTGSGRTSVLFLPHQRAAVSRCSLPAAQLRTNLSKPASGAARMITP